jgi:DNA-binding Lrp family transcriptional regulator
MSKKIDHIDYKILNYIEEHGNAENLKKASKELNMPTATLHKRIKNLFDKGIITKTNYEINPEKLGIPLLALIAVKVKHERAIEELNKNFANNSNTVISFETYGAFDYLLGVYAKSPDDLYEIKERIRENKEVDMVYSAYVGKKFRFSTIPFPLKEE